ncbi:MAG: heme lyase CcmF/NrfE family subunit [Chloroflexi bacterium]|nr:heme lyase CcmF/NrfE family subunit [Chloroflexota bacterium]
MADIGFLSLTMAFVVTFYGVVAGIWGYHRDRLDIIESSRRALFAFGILMTIGVVALWYLLLTDDFRVEYVAGHSERALPTLYKFAALWGGQAGSLLFWGWILGLYSMAAVAWLKERHPELNAYVYTVLHAIALFFTALLLFGDNPFRLLPFTPPDGNSLNPLLQNYWMVVHPIGLYLGYIGFTVPFAYAMAALITGNLGNAWVRTIRLWTLIPWVFLSLGILMGSQWAYMELGWGGYWAWDPVENASFLPWLTGTAFLHSIMIQERRGMLKVWNVVLIFLTFWLTILGTFITRSGVIESVHAFALSNIGPMFLAFLAILLLGFLFILFRRLPLLQGDNELDAMLSRESAFLFANVLFVSIAFTTLLGTMWPILSELFTGDKLTVSAPFFNKVNGPIFAVLLFTIGVGPLLPWRRANWTTLRHQLQWPTLASILMILLLLVLGERRPWPLVGFGLVALVFVSIVQEYVRGVRARMRATGEKPWQALARLFRRNQRRYGGYIVHLGVVLMALGIIGNGFYQVDNQAALNPGESMTVGDYRLVYDGLFERRQSNHTEVYARIRAFKGDRELGVLEPKRNIYDKQPEQPTTEIALRPGLVEDLYIVLAGWENGGKPASFKAYVNPLMSWLWIGGFVVILGGLMAAWRRPRRLTARVKLPRKAVAQTA